MLAIESLRMLIPFEEEDDWVDESDFPSWLLLPKTIDVSWGHELHQKMASLVRTEIEKFIAGINNKPKKNKVK